MVRTHVHKNTIVYLLYVYTIIISYNMIINSRRRYNGTHIIKNCFRCENNDDDFLVKNNSPIGSAKVSIGFHALRLRNNNNNPKLCKPPRDQYDERAIYRHFITRCVRLICPSNITDIFFSFTPIHTVYGE